MSIAQSVRNSIESIPAGKIFDYQVFPDYVRSPSAVIKAVNRLVTEQKLTRFSKGKFYVPEEGLFGPLKPSDGELVRSMLYKDGRLRGYVTEALLYNQLGLSTQLPRKFTLAFNGGRQDKEFGTIGIKTVVTRIPIKEKDVKLLQYLDALKDIKKILGSEVNQSLRIMRSKITELTDRERKRLVALAVEYYNPQTRALLCLLFSSLGLSVPESLAQSLNPTTTYKIGLDLEKWPTARRWKVR